MLEPRPRPNAAMGREHESVIIVRMYCDLGVDEVGICRRDGRELVGAASAVSQSRVLEKPHSALKVYIWGPKSLNRQS